MANDIRPNAPASSRNRDEVQQASPWLTPVEERNTFEDFFGPASSTADVTKSVHPPRLRPTDDPRELSKDGISFFTGRDTPLSMHYPSSRRSTIDSSKAAGLESSRWNGRKMSVEQIEELTSTPGSIPVRALSSELQPGPDIGLRTEVNEPGGTWWDDHEVLQSSEVHGESTSDAQQLDGTAYVTARFAARALPRSMPLARRPSEDHTSRTTRPSLPRALTIPQPPSARQAFVENHRVLDRSIRHAQGWTEQDHQDVNERYLDSKRYTSPILPSPPPSPLSNTIPLPPLSMPTHLHLELSLDRPSPLYIQSNVRNDTPFEPSRVKFDRLLNFLLLPPKLEHVLLFGALTCLDAWLYTFTILPLRFFRALWILLTWLLHNLWMELRFLAGFIYEGTGRIWHRSRRRTVSLPRETDVKEHADAERSSLGDGKGSGTRAGIKTTFEQTNGRLKDQGVLRGRRHHRRTKSVPSLLQPNHKADILQGLLIVTSCVLLMRYDASRMYHGIRGQAAIKLYVIYNVLEVCDRLLSAVGQDIMECLFSSETLERKPNGRSKVFRPSWMFLLALFYTVLHASAFFYQVITLNVAVNSYSNALLTLLMSNQFVEIKGTVFKKFEKENLFQLTCADVVERFQLWLMLLIIALRNIVELGGLSLNTSSSASDFSSTSSSSTSGASNPNVTAGATTARAFSILPHSFTLLPSPAQIQLLTPFLLVLGSEMLVDWLKHAYITKFNATSPRVYSRYLDVLAKDYYSNAFGPQNLVRRLGLPVIPLTCLFIRSCLQTYHMFLATNVSTTSTSFTSSSSTTSLSVDNGTATASASPALAQIDAIFRNALGRSSFGGGSSNAPQAHWWSAWTVDDVIAFTTMLVFFLAVYLLLLAFKLVLGMVLLSMARERYKGMSKREAEDFVEKDAKRLGPGGLVEVGEGRRRVIYEGDDDGLRDLRDKEEKVRRKEERGGRSQDKLDSVERYAMVAKRIW